MPEKENAKKTKTLGDDKQDTELKSDNLLDIKIDLTRSKIFGDKGKFVLEIPNPGIRLEIGKRLGVYFGVPIERVPVTDLTMARVVVTLDLILTEYPDWWPGALQMYDTDFMMDLYTWFLEEDLLLKQKLKKNKLGAIRRPTQE